MSHFIKFRLKEDFNRFCREPPHDLTVDYVSNNDPVVIVSGLTQERIPEIEAAYNAKVYEDQKFDPLSPA